MLGRMKRAYQAVFGFNPTKDGFRDWCREMGYRPGRRPDVQLVASYLAHGDPSVNDQVGRAIALRDQWYPAPKARTGKAR